MKLFFVKDLKVLCACRATEQVNDIKIPIYPILQKEIKTKPETYKPDIPTNSFYAGKLSTTKGLGEIH